MSPHPASRYECFIPHNTKIINAVPGGTKVRAETGASIQEHHKAKQINNINEELSNYNVL